VIIKKGRNAIWSTKRIGNSIYQGGKIDMNYVKKLKCLLCGAEYDSNEVKYNSEMRRRRRFRNYL